MESQRVESAIKGILTPFFLEHQNKPSISSVCFITDLFRKLRHLLNQSVAKLKPIATWLSALSRARDHLCVSTLSFRGFPCYYFFFFFIGCSCCDDVKLCCDWLWCFPFVLRHSTESVLKLKNAWAQLCKGRIIGSCGPRSLFTICLFVFASKIQWEMAGPEQYSLVETSEERNLITSTNLPCEILLGWFMAEKLQSFTSSGFDARRFENTSNGLFALCLLSLVRSMGHGSRILSFSFSVRKNPNY